MVATTFSVNGIEIVIRDGTETLETRSCRTMLLPDGRSGAVWRGLVYPVQEATQIDIAGEAFPPAACAGGFAPLPDAAQFASITGADEVYLLLSGSVAARETAATSLRAAGISVLRTGRYLGDVIDGFAGDWFVRFEKPASDEPIDELLARVLGRERVKRETPSASEIRLRLVQDELTGARVRETSLRSELAGAKATLAQHNLATIDDDALRTEIANEQRFRYEAEAGRTAAEAALEALRAHIETVRAEPAVPRQGSLRTRLRDEMSDVLGTLLPNVNLVRDSLTVATSEYASRKALYRSLAELGAVELRLPANWKAVQGVTGWWERHVSDGQDNTGRLYVRYLPGNRRWDVLISDKAEQPRDMAWLRRQAAS